MSDGGLLVDPEARRALALDALAAILPAGRRDRLATVLSDEDVATLRHLAKLGIGDNTLRALTSDLAYLEAWCRAAVGASLPWPALESLVLKFVAHHLWDPTERAADPDHGMPEEVTSRLRVAAFCGLPAHMHRRRCSGVSPAGRRCIVGRASTGRSDRRR